MTTTTETAKSHWDLSHILDFVNALAPNAGTQPPPSRQDVGAEEPQSQTDTNNTLATRNINDTARLGDFSKVWQFLGSPSHSIEFPPSSNYPPKIAPNKDDYASDGAIYRHERTAYSKGQRASEGTDGDEPTASASDAQALTKNQRKKLRRKERRAVEQAQKNYPATVSESEADTVTTKNPARKASAHTVLNTSVSRYNFRPRNGAGIVEAEVGDENKLAALQAAQKTIREIVAANKQSMSPIAIAAEVERAESLATVKAAVFASEAEGGGKEQLDAFARTVASRTRSEHPSTPTPKPRETTLITPYTQQNNPTGQIWSPQQAHSTTPYKSTAVQLIPSSVQPMLSGKPSAPNGIKDVATTMAPFSTTSKKKTAYSKPVIEPIIVRSGEDRHWALLIKIIANFYEDRKYLVAPMTLTTHNNDPKGIHVFVDASNIFIGFKDQLKRSRGIHPLANVGEVELSFDALALLIERRRPVAKRALTGSTPHLSTFDKAKRVGYDCSILEKVYKARELTERQIYFKELDARRSGGPPRVAPPSNRVNLTDGPQSSSPHDGRGGSGSGSETTTPQYAPLKLVEQGVDEVLHMKMLESVVDFDEPTTIVLATGDAAAAEFSPGFQMNVQRALRKGWRVELVSWSKNISNMYKKKQWTDAWGERFRIIYLDDYAEELLDM